jgi:hypothetical protein
MESMRHYREIEHGLPLLFGLKNSSLAVVGEGEEIAFCFG